MDLVFNTAAFVAVLAKEVLYDRSAELTGVQKASATILAIAATQYAVSALIGGDVAQEIRYVDWLATTPLLLSTFWGVAERDGWDRPFYPLALAVMTMIAMGYAAEVSGSKHVFAASLIPYAYVLREVRGMQNLLTSKGRRDGARLAWFFAVGWAAYPVAFWLPPAQKSLLYSGADLFNKAVYSLCLMEAVHPRCTRTACSTRFT